MFVYEGFVGCDFIVLVRTSDLLVLLGVELLDFGCDLCGFLVVDVEIDDDFDVFVCVVLEDVLWVGLIGLM